MNAFLTRIIQHPAMFALMLLLVQEARDTHAQCTPGTCFGTFATVGTYDENTVNLNAVDAEYINNNITLADFTLDVTNAYNGQSGGVINFDTIQDAVENPALTSFGVLYGSDLSFDLVVTRQQLVGQTGGINTNTNHTVISGANYLGNSGNGAVTMQFSSPLSLFGMTILNRGGQTGNLTIRYDDATTYNFGGPIATANGQDTFFGHEAPVGKKIAGFSWQGLTGSAFIRTDDWAFIVADFQPGDADGDLDVDLFDYAIIRDNLGKTGVSIPGDVRSNGLVDLNDFKLWKQFYPTAGPLGSLASSTSVPEPTSLLLGLLGAVAYLGGRRRQR